MHNSNKPHDNIIEEMPAGIRIETSEAVVIINPILTEESYCCTVTQEDIESANRFGNSHRRASFLAWRKAVRQEVGECCIGYNEIGAPIITDKPLYIGVSHSSEMAGVIISSKTCAIDIEKKGRNYSTTAPRFITADEAKLPQSDNPDFQAIIWCAKETLYKISQRRELDLLKDISITSVDFDSMIVMGRIRSQNGCGEAYDMPIISQGDIIGIFAVHA